MTTQDLKSFLKKLIIHLNEEGNNFYILIQWSNMDNFFVVLKHKTESVAHAHGLATTDTIFEELENLTLQRFILTVYVNGIAKSFIKEHCHELLKQGQLA